MNPERIRNVFSDWFIHILFYFSLRNYSLKKINNLLWPRGEVGVLQWCILISQIRLLLASCCWFFCLFLFLQPGSMVTPGEWPILQTARATFVARRTPPMSEYGHFFFLFVWFYGLSWNLWITFALILADFIRRLKFINRTSFIFFPKTVGCFILYNLRHHCHIAYIRMHKGSA